MTKCDIAYHISVWSHTIIPKSRMTTFFAKASDLDAGGSVSGHDLRMARCEECLVSKQIKMRGEINMVYVLVQEE